MTARPSETDAFYEGEYLPPIRSKSEIRRQEEDRRRKAAPRTAKALRRMARPPTDSRGRPIPPPPGWWSKGPTLDRRTGRQ